MIALGAAGSGSLTWLWVLIGVIVVVAVVVLALAGRGFGPFFGRRSVVLGGWLAGAIDAYEKGLALHEAVRDASRPGAAARQAQWADIVRSVADLERLLHRLHDTARDPEDRAGATDALGSLRELRSAIDGRDRAGQAAVIRARLDAFEASLRRLRPPERHIW
jgi:hypothetical protein